MSDDKQKVMRARSPPSDATPSSKGPSSPFAEAPPGHTFRRAMTVDEAAQLRRRPTLGQFSAESSFDSPRRRSSNFSDYSLGEARKTLRESTDDILNPHGSNLETNDNSNWASLPLAFALLPAVAGVFVQNGSAFISDVLLLALAGVFLRYTVVQPWQWYHSAQEVRVREELANDYVFDDDSEAEAAPVSPHRPPPPTSTATLEDVPEESSPSAADKEVPSSGRQNSKMREEALNELYIHEILALLSCFVCPVIGAYLLHAIRSQLSRPSEGLVSNFNITIFLLGAEVAPLSHAIKLVQARTLHLQRLVVENPYKPSSSAVTPAQLGELTRRLEELESRAISEAQPDTPGRQDGNSDQASRGRQEAAMVREVRNAIQPELDALNRAVRRYEKKATVLAFQTESRLGAIDTRLNDAISLAAAAAKNNNAQWSIAGWLMEWAVSIILLPFQSFVRLIMLPFRTVSAVVTRKKPVQEKNSRPARNGRTTTSNSRPGSDRDRVPSRLSKR